MALANTSTSYGAAARWLHWLTAAGILVMIPLGWIAHFAPWDSDAQLALKAQLFSAHKTLGIAVLAVAVLRILWALGQPRPVPLHPARRLETLVAETVHWSLYGALILVPLTGWIEHAATDGFAPILWPLGQSLPMVPKSEALAETFATLHFYAQWALVLVLGLHVAGAVKHAAVDRDATLARMARGVSAGTEGNHGAPLAALALAAVFWLAVLGGGIGQRLLAPEAAEAATLAEVDSDWQVREGTLAIRLVQMGSEVSGSFADWTAEIDFAPKDGPGKTGEVTVQVAVPSLTLGTVTKQAMGPDFFDATQFPTATFRADLMKAADGHVAEGTLSLKGHEVPVSLPFQLVLDGDRAEMSGRLTLDRRAFGIGESMGNPDQLSFDVEVLVDLVAERAGGR
ncbi:cytochrome b/b6 domain-containing protein [Salipiger sp.]|uniref:cytochrome b/b6 domain-containing protein n=1 Tax=Salipiger sp. TaxID=2078585 RepID=UPI003A97705F